MPSTNLFTGTISLSQLLWMNSRLFVTSNSREFYESTEIITNGARMTIEKNVSTVLKFRLQMILCGAENEEKSNDKGSIKSRSMCWKYFATWVLVLSHHTFYTCDEQQHLNYVCVEPNVRSRYVHVRFCLPKANFRLYNEKWKKIII